MKKLVLFFLFISPFVSFSQSITIDASSNSANDLVSLLLNNACVETSNIQVSSLKSVAKFNNNGGNFPLSQGVVIRSGDALFTQGAYTDSNLSSQINNNSDSELALINQASGQSSTLTDVAFLEFEFTPLSSDFNFNFLFASNEYGQWQCVSSDVFAFFLTNLTTGQTTNLAVIPNTNTPISVKNIKDNAYNNSCSSDNAKLFEKYTVNTPQNSSVNMRGYTQVMKASSKITPGVPYKIRLIIADSNDSSYDSAIFLDAGSFNANLDLGDDKFICNGDSQTITTNLNINDYDHSWTYNGQTIANANQNTLVITQPGTYKVLVTKKNTNCVISDEITISALTYKNPNDIELCFNKNGTYLFDLTKNNKKSLDILNSEYEIHYFNSIQNINTLNQIPTTNLNNYYSLGNETIYIKLYNTTTGNYCNSIDSFNLSTTPPLGLTQPEPIGICTNPNSKTIISLQQVNANILGGLPESNFSFTYYNSLLDAENQKNSILNITEFKIASNLNSKKIWVLVTSNFGLNCSEIIEVELIMNTPPPVSILPDAIVCESYFLPSITYGNYYTAPNGGGQQLPAGYEVINSGTIYIFNGPDQNGCTNQSNFKVIIVKEISIKETYCEKFLIPSLSAGEFYTAPGGPKGKGTLLPSKSIIKQSQTIWYYAEVNNVFCTEKSFNITILPLPPVDEIEDVVTCTNYQLPNLTNGKYFSKPNGKGQQLFTGQYITSTQTIYIYNDDGVCDNEHKFTVTIVPTFENKTVCGEYILPKLPIGNYYTQSNGKGQIIPAGSLITQSQTVYYFTHTTTNPNCTENTSFTVQVIPIPPVDSLNDITLCEGEFYILPSIINGNFYTKPDAQGELLQPGTSITSSQDIYIYNQNNGCSNQSSFNINIKPLPLVANFTDVYTCDSYELPVIENGNYYTQSLKQGKLLQAGDFIYETQTIYIYNEYDNLQGCYNEDFFTIYVEGIQLEEVSDIYACEPYILPPLEIGEYYTEPGKNGNKLYPGKIIFHNQEIFIHAQNGSRFSCEAEKSFTVYITKPNLDNYEDIEACGTYTLPPPIDNNNVSINYYWGANATNPLSKEDYTFDKPGNYLLYIYGESTVNPDCYDEKEIIITIYEQPQLYIEGGTICKNVITNKVESPFYLTSGLEPTEFEVNWYLENKLVYQGTELEATQAGEYYVEVIKLKPEKEADCNYLPTRVTVTESGKPEIKAIITEPFKDIANINIEIIKGLGNYLYSLDGQTFQNQPTFHNVSSGTHTIMVKGENGDCGSTLIEVDVIKYQKFFTPNQDGINDTWNIVDLKFDRNATVSIFDRFGKLLTVIATNEKGWEGNYHGKQMPSNEYWFLVDFTYEGRKRKFKSHFTLKR